MDFSLFVTKLFANILPLVLTSPLALISPNELVLAVSASNPPLALTLLALILPCVPEPSYEPIFTPFICNELALTRPDAFKLVVVIIPVFLISPLAEIYPNELELNVSASKPLLALTLLALINPSYVPGPPILIPFVCIELAVIYAEAVIFVANNLVIVPN